MRITVASPNPAPLNILIVDADAFFRRGVREFLNEAAGMRVVGEAADGEHALELADRLSHSGLDLVLIDLDLPQLDGISTIQRLAADHPEVAVIVLTLATSERDLVEAVRGGAVGILSKHLGPDAVVRALRGFHDGESLPISRDIGLKLLALVRSGDEPDSEADAAAVARLTAREREVLGLVASGARDRDIAARLVVSESTVKKHLQNILRKFQARNRAEAVARWRSRRGG